MTRTCWLTAALVLLLALNAGPARCQEPAPKSKDCCEKYAHPCDGAEGDTTSCPKCTTAHGVQEKVAELMKRYATCFKEGKYKEAEEYARAACELDPANAAAGAALKIALLQRPQAAYLHGEADEKSACCSSSAAEATCCPECAAGCKCCSKCKATAASCAKDAAGTCRPNCTGAASKCPKCDDAPCCQGTARAAACCDECANGCKCCPKCREAAACSAKGAAGTCCVQPAGCGACAGTGAATGCCTKPCRGKKPGTVIFLPLPPLPGSPIPVPPILPVGFAEPAPPMPPAYNCPMPAPAWQPVPADNVYVAEPPCPPCYAHPVPMMPPPAVACSVAQPCRHASCACCMKLSAEDGKAHLEVAGCGETAMTCESLVLKVSGSSPLKVAVADKQVQISNSYLKATADSVARMSGDDCLVLEGNVHLDYHKDDKHTEAAADRVVIGLADGSFKIEPVATPDAKATWHMLAPDSSIQQVFGFWIGTFR